MPTTRELFHVIDTSAFPVNNLLTDQLFCVDAVAELPITSKLRRGKLNNGETLDCAYGLVVGKYQLFSEAGVERVEKLGTRPSLFGGTMYSALAERSRR